MRSAVTRLAPYFAFALLCSAPLARRPGQSIGGRRFGGGSGILEAHRQLPFQVGDLFFGVDDLLLFLSELLKVLRKMLLVLSDLLGLLFELLP